MVTFYVFLVIVAAVGAFAYVMLFFSHVPGAKDERLGALEDLPENLGTWVVAQEAGTDGLIREERHLFSDPSGLRADRLVFQVRYRDPVTSEIVRVEPEQMIRRRRVRK